MEKPLNEETRIIRGIKIIWNPTKPIDDFIGYETFVKNNFI
jgi:hypothetical protein